MGRWTPPPDSVTFTTTSGAVYPERGTAASHLTLEHETAWREQEETMKRPEEETFHCERGGAYERDH